MERRKNETEGDYLKRLFAEGDNAIKNLKKVTSDMKRLGIIGFCKECGGDIYNNKKHNCK